MNPQYKKSSHEDNQSDLGERIGRPYGDLYQTEALKILKNRGFFGVTLPVMYVLPDAEAELSANWVAPFFRANRTYQVLECVIRYTNNAVNDDTLDLVKNASGIISTAGTSVLSAKIDLTGVVETDHKGSISTVPGIAVIPAGTCLSIVPKNSPKSEALRGLTVYVLLKAI